MAQNVLLPPSRRSLYLYPPLTILAEIVGDDSSILGLFCVQISLDYMKLCGRYGQKRAKNAKKCVRLAIRRGSYLGSPWTVLAEILGDDSPMLGLPCARNSLDCFKARGSSVCKCGKNSPKNQFFEKVQYRYVSAWVQNQVSQVPQTLTHSGKMSETTPHSVGGEQPFCLAVHIMDRRRYWF